jgi:hypothetical protein
MRPYPVDLDVPLYLILSLGGLHWVVRRYLLINGPDEPVAFEAAARRHRTTVECRTNRLGLTARYRHQSCQARPPAGR